MMRITIPCPDVQSYNESPKNFLPDRPTCCNNSCHRPQWHARWERELCQDHVNATNITLFNAYCQECHETISYWPEFVLPYQREPLETHEQVVVEHLQGRSLRESALKIGYDPRTLSRWLKLFFVQALIIMDKVVPRILHFMGQEILPLTATVAREAVVLLLTWLRNYSRWIEFPHLNRLTGLCNMLGKGDWDLWGAPLGNAKPRVKIEYSPG
jgi:hypothetical protein